MGNVPPHRDEKKNLDQKHDVNRTARPDAGGMPKPPQRSGDQPATPSQRDDAKRPTDKRDQQR
jgi:hypothetical protein